MNKTMEFWSVLLGNGWYCEPTDKNLFIPNNSDGDIVVVISLPSTLMWMTRFTAIYLLPQTNAMTIFFFFFYFLYFFFYTGYQISTANIHLCSILCYVRHRFTLLLLLFQPFMSTNAHYSDNFFSIHHLIFIKSNY